MRNSGIGTKILIILLITGLAPALILAAVSVTVILDVSQYSMDANTRLAVRTAEDAQNALLGQSEEYIVKIVQEQTLKFENILRQVQAELEALSVYMQFLYANEGLLKGQPPPAPEQTQMGLASAKYILAPGVEPGPALEREISLLGNCEFLFAPLFQQNSMNNNIYLGTESGISYRYSRSNEVSPDYDPRRRGWYIQARKNSPRPVWVDTYIDAFGKLCVTCAVAFRAPDGTLLGVIAIDVTPQEMQVDIENTRIGRTGFAFLLDTAGVPVAQAVRPARPSSGPDQAGLAPFIETVKFGLNSLLSAEVEGVPYYVAWASLPSTGWRYCLAQEKAEIIAPALATKAQVDAYVAEAQAHIHRSIQNVLFDIPAIISLTAGAILLAAFFLSRTIAAPLEGRRESVTPPEEEAGGGRES